MSAFKSCLMPLNQMENITTFLEEERLIDDVA
jgi:hypothetical protein